MSKLQALETLEGDSFKVERDDDGTFRFKGVVALRDPTVLVGGYFKRVHAAAVADAVEQVTLDVTALEFMNSSAIRVFIDWIEWIRTSSHQYRLHCVTNSRTTWQRSTFSALRSMSAAHLTVEARAN